MVLKYIGYLTLAAFLSIAPVKGVAQEVRETVILNQTKFNRVPSYVYQDMDFQYAPWKNISKGLQFTKIEVYKKGEHVDSVAVVRADPKHNSFGVFNGFNQKTLTLEESLTIEEWQKKTGATVMFNSGMYAAKPWGMPVAIIKSNNERKGFSNKKVMGVFVAGPLKGGLPLADLLDLKYDSNVTDSYKEAVQHWLMLLDREQKIRIKPSDWQASRTVIAKDFKGNILAFTTEGGFFTLYNFGRFLRDNKEKLNIHTAMSLDGGYEADMIIKTPSFNYITYGWAETYGRDRNASMFGKISIPGAIGIFPR